MNKPIGILGGMGPQATVDAMNKIIKNTMAKCDQEHIPVITVSIPDIPDRTESILNHNDKPLKKMTEYLKILENANVGCIIIPCNTAHFWFDQLQKRTHTKMISIIESTVKHIEKTDTKEVCILATSATISTQLYQNKFAQNNINYSIPSPSVQQKIMESIYKYKAAKYEESKELINQIINLYDLNSDIKFLLACTELPLILEDWIKSHPNLFIDATDLLIRNAINWYQYEQKI
ncbi:amino acid racemase [Acinetobacter baumannii]|uniref:Amino acid racemase n=1 Tax=Acinetobacter baumannii TaxID=470 RepID=A0A505MGN2_ACIBA|nr:amino acid racemase [Acinetobacter baumannii]EHZ7972684.1 aspartate/glutamate racemase family protein [Acinetobacter baumannii]EIO2225064.1 aspartate/glutamate racemase family protein [Acinetobacter baumannii]EJB8496108.1 aspartate/glutamate racemase family protein [Acinetobacter baumannii]EKU0972126.1 aspartate/glutamate racemase family protein [Acinetobacter baumannii]EKU4294236.1 aspartate/glutamate racemase family protein [Acinetobacter baumannii]